MMVVGMWTWCLIVWTNRSMQDPSLWNVGMTALSLAGLLFWCHAVEAKK